MAQSNGPRPPTIYDVAQRAGVSIATVSRVFRGTAPVAVATRTRVLDAVAELGFTPSRAGRSLAEGRHAANGIVFPDLSGPYYAEVVLGYEEAAGELGRSVLILSTHGRQAAAEMVIDLAGRVDGLVILGRTVDDEVVSKIAATRLPIVLLARPAIGEIVRIAADNTGSAAELAAHLAAHGHRRLALIGDPAASPDVAERWAAILSAIGPEVREELTGPVRCGFDEQSGHRAARDLLRTGALPRPDALVCANDELALGAMLAAEELGLRVPDDIAITGWDDIMAARYARPALTTVQQPMRQLGARAARTLHALITGQSAASQVLPTRLVVRASCGRH
jgi:LacI family transcriptional regulator